MNHRTVRALNDINRRFYREASDDFDASRGHPWPGWSRVADHLEFEAGAPTRILDVGCGNARFGAFLADRFESARDKLHYTGIDASASLLQRARERELPIAHCELIQQDLIEALLDDSADTESARLRDHSRWTSDAAGPGYALIALFGVLHHVPSAALRAELLVRLGRQLAPGGLLVVACWQFGAFARFRDKIIPWDEYNGTAARPIDTAQLEPGDHLLPWRDDAELRRYCHFADELEIQSQLERDFVIVASYTNDGREGRLNRYFICRYSGPRNESKET